MNEELNKYFKNLDNMHYDFHELDGYNKTFNFVVSPREPGKTTAMELFKIYLPFITKGETFIMLVDNATDITPEYITSIEEGTNKFLINPIEITYKVTSLKTGIVDCYVDGKRYIRFISLNCPIVRIKKTIINNISYMGKDEFIKNPKFKEKYLPGEYDRFREIYNTYRRNKPNLKVYFLGNPYSMYNPYFVALNINTKRLIPGARIIGETFIIQLYVLKPELVDYILKTNPLYKFDDSYKNYALNGVAVNDLNIPIEEKVYNHSLTYIFKFEETYIGIWKNNLPFENDNIYWCNKITDFSSKRNVVCFNFDDMLEGTTLMTRDDKLRFSKLKYAMSQRKVTFESIEIYYMFTEIYYNL